MNRAIEHPIEWDDQKVSRLWDYYSRTPPYSEVYFSDLFGDQMLRLSGLPLQEPLEVLDFGCGPGFIWEHAMRLQARWQYTALDFSAESVAKATTRAAGHPQFKGASHVTSLPSSLPDAHFDAVLLFEVVEHLKDEYLGSTLNEAFRVLRPGGVLVVSTPNQEDLNAATRFCPECGAVFHDWQHVRSWSVESLSQRLATHGFSRRVAHTLDFRARTAVTKAVKFARRVVHGKRPDPHMLAVFHKPPAQR